MPSVDDRVVSMDFDNENFEKRISDTMSSLSQLQASLDQTNNTTGFDQLSSAANSINLDGLANGIDNISSKFSALGVIGFTALQDLTNSAIGAAKTIASTITGSVLTGGKDRAVQIQQAQFQFQGLGMDVETSMASAKQAVLGTAYSLASAASAAAQFGAAGVKAGPPMVSSLRAIAGVAAMTGANYDDISQIFTTVAGNGKLMGNQLMQLSTRGLNAAAALAKSMHLPEASVRQMVSEGKISFQQFSDAMDQSFGAHATSANETYTGSLSNMHAALARLGADFQTPAIENKRNIFNALSPQIDAVATAIGPVIKDFQFFSTMSTNSLVSKIKAINFDKSQLAIATVINSINKAFIIMKPLVTHIADGFKLFFPGSFQDTLLTIAVAFQRFINNLSTGAGIFGKISTLFYGIFAAFKIVVEVGKGVFLIFSELIGIFASMSSGSTLNFFDALAHDLIRLSNTISAKGIVDGFNKFLATLVALSDQLGITDKIKAAHDAILSLATAIFGFFTDIAANKSVDNLSSGLSSASSALNSTKEGAVTLADVLDKRLHISSIIDLVANGLSKIKDIFLKVFDIGKDIVKSIMDSFKPDNYSSALDVLNTGLFAGIVLLLRKFVHTGLKLNIGNGLFDNIKNGLNSLTSTLNAMQLKLKSEALKQLAIAIAILTASVVVLSLINSAALTKALAAMTVGFGQLIGTLVLLDKYGGSGKKSGAKTVSFSSQLIALSSAILILSVAMKVLATMKPEEIAKGLGAIMLLLASLAGYSKLMADNTKGMLSSSVGMIAIGVAMNFLAVAMKIFATMSWEEIGKGLAGVAGSLIAIAGAMHLMPKGMVLQSVGLVAIGGALNLIGTSMKIFASMSWGEIGKGLATMALSLGLIAVAMNLMPATLPLTASGLVLVSGSLIVISTALKIFASMSLTEMAKGLGTLAISLGILAIATDAMTSGLVGAVAIGIAAASLILLSIAIGSFAAIGWKNLLIGMAGIAIALAALALGAMAMMPAIPAILALGVALAVLGGAFALFGLGASLVANAFAILASAGKNGVATLSMALDIIIKKLPQFIAAFGQGLILLASEFLKAAPTFVAGITSLISQLLTSLQTLIPQFGATLTLMIITGLNMIITLTPKIIATGFFVLMSFLQGISDNIETITDTVINIILKFVTTLTSRMSDIVTAGTNLLVSFISGISDNLDKIVGAIGGLVLRLIYEVGQQADNIMNAGFAVLLYLLNSLSNDVDNVVNALGDFIENLMTAVGKKSVEVMNVGVAVLLYMIKGVKDNVIKLATGLGDIIITGMHQTADLIRKDTKRFRSAAADLASAILDGLTLGLFSSGPLGKLKDGFVNIAKKGLGWIKGAFGIHSPSKETMKIGGWVVDGLAIGLNSNERISTKAAGDVAANALDAFNSNITKKSDTINGTIDTQPVITPVVDLSNVKDSSKKINQLLQPNSLTKVQPISAVASTATATAAQIAVANAFPKPGTEMLGGPVVQNTEIKFEQNNTSPTALSTADIYRNTKSQISMAKDALKIQ